MVVVEGVVVVEEEVVMGLEENMEQDMEAELVKEVVQDMVVELQEEEVVLEEEVVVEEQKVVQGMVEVKVVGVVVDTVG